MKKHNSGLTALLVSLVLSIAVEQAHAFELIFTNPSPITISNLNAAAASPYPLTATVSGLGPILDLNVAVNGLSHTFPSDIGILIVGPGGQKVVLMNLTGGSTPITNVTIVFDDEASSSLPFSGPITSGSYKPTNFGPTDSFAPPALAAGPYSSSLSIFDGTLPNGIWSLFVRDFVDGEGGSISGGFGLRFSVDETPSFLLLGIGLLTGGFVLRKVKWFNSSNRPSRAARADMA